MYQRPKLKGFTLPSWEQPYIQRQPHSSIHTRKKERVSMADVNYMIDVDPTRVNEGVSYLPRGANVMTDVTFNNYGSSSTNNTMPNIQASLPYKVEVVRPPMYGMEDLQPLSRQKYPDYSVQSAVGSDLGFAPPLETVSDKKGTNFSLRNPLLFSARPTAVYKMDLPKEVFTKNAINVDKINVKGESRFNIPYKMDMTVDRSNPIEASRDPLQVQSSTNPNNPLSIESRNEEINIDNYLKKILVGQIDPNFSIVIYNPNDRNYSEVAGSIKDKLNIAAQTSIGIPIELASENGQKIKLKDYRWKIVTSNVGGGDTLVLNAVNNPELHLDRNVPLYSIGSSVVSLPDYNNTRMQENEIDLKSKLNPSIAPVIGKAYGNGKAESIFDSERNILLRRVSNYGNFGEFRTTSGIPLLPQLQNREIPNLPDERAEIERNIRNEMGDRFNDY